MAREKQLRRSEREPYLLSIGPNCGSVKGTSKFAQRLELHNNSLRSGTADGTLTSAFLELSTTLPV
jgi:hypothetical protein